MPFDRSAAGHIQTIGIVTPSFPNEASVELASSVGQSFGLVGALIDAAMLADRNSRFGKAIDPQNFSAREYYTRLLSQALVERGYKVVVLPLERDSREFVPAYPPAAESKVDAYLDTVVESYGYVAAGIGGNTPYRPHLRLRARLASGADTSVLMQDSIAYNYVGPAMGQSQSITLAPDAAHRFDNFDVLIADPQNAVKGMQTAIEKSAEAISHLLK